MPLILLLTGVVTAVAVVLSLAQTKEYEATSRVVLSQTDPINNIIETVAADQLRPGGGPQHAASR